MSNQITTGGIPNIGVPIMPGSFIQIQNSPHKPYPEDVYVTKIKSRVSVPIKGLGFDTGGASLEMTTAQAGNDIEFTILLPGRQAIPFTVHRRDIEALVGELTLDKLSK